MAYVWLVIWQLAAMVSVVESFAFTFVAHRLGPAPSNRNLTTRYLPRLCRFATAGDNGQTDPNRVAIVGGGLAGLSTAFHLLQKTPHVDITILDKAPPGTAGASSVAGGLLHPLSPRGKLVHLGLEGLASTNTLLEAASLVEPHTILRDDLYRMALTDQHVSTLKETAKNLPELTQWMEADEFVNVSVLGALRLFSGCKVVHMPSYLRGLWAACEKMGGNRTKWVVDASTMSSSPTQWRERLASYDTVVLCAGAGLFQDNVLNPRKELPIKLVRGQSIEITLNGGQRLANAMLCGKYVSPLVEDNRALIGATHEFKDEPFSASQVQHELKSKSYAFAPNVWDQASADRITTGYRVQSNRGRYGRMPIVGRYNEKDLHENAWIFTGLSSRGLLYHGVFGDMLTDVILGRHDKEPKHPDLNWWCPK